jgi:aspartate-semialdehyde dehydrogenase
VLCTDNPDSAVLAEALRDKARFIIDMSSEFRLHNQVPLVIPEINPDTVTAKTQLIASPNCTTTALVMALAALRGRYELREVFFCSYQALSGGGKKLLEEAGRPDSIYYKNCVPKIGSIQDNGYTSEELKSVYETRKILGMPGIKVYPHTVRVPVENGHSLGVTVRMATAVDRDEAIKLLDLYPGLTYSEDILTPRECDGKPGVFICRVRCDVEDPALLHFFLVMDNTLKGAAGNGAQIIELLMKRGLL